MNSWTFKKMVSWDINAIVVLWTLKKDVEFESEKKKNIMFNVLGLYLIH